MVEHTFLYGGPVAWLKEHIDRGALGEVRCIHSQRLNLGRAQADVDALWNVGPHDVSIALHLLGGLPVEVSARGASYLQPGVADVVFLNMAYADGRLAHAHLSWLDPVKVRRTTVVGTRAAVVYDDTAAETPIAVFDRSISAARPGEAGGDGPTRTHRGDVTLPALQLEEPLHAACRHFVDCVQQRRRPRADGRHGLEVVRVLAAAARSMADGGRPIAVGKD
jgi:predicted dehydrogenase